MDKKAPSPRPPLQETVNLGPGLFIGDKAQASCDAACLKFGVLQQADGVAPALTEEEVRRQLLEACRQYWSDHKYNNRITLVDIRNEVIDLLKGIESLLPALNKLSYDARARLEFELTRSETAGDKFIPKMRTELERLHSVSAAIAKYRGTKKGSSRTSVLNCCARLMALRSQLTGRPFSKTWTEKPGEGSSVDAFTGRDAQFVLEVIKAIDGTVTFANVRSVGMTLARKRAKKK